MNSELLYKFRSSTTIMFRRNVDTKTFNFKNIIQYLKIFIFSQKCFNMRWGSIFTKKIKFFYVENDENLKFLKMNSELLYKFCSSIIIMFR